MTTMIRTDTVRARGTRGSYVRQAVVAALLLSGAACGTDQSVTPAGSPAVPMPFDPLEESMDDYFDNCQWAKGCGGLPGAWNGDPDNSLNGHDDIVPLDPAPMAPDTGFPSGGDY